MKIQYLWEHTDIVRTVVIAHTWVRARAAFERFIADDMGFGAIQTPNLGSKVGKSERALVSAGTIVMYADERGGVIRTPPLLKPAMFSDLIKRTPKQ